MDALSYEVPLRDGKLIARLDTQPGARGIALVLHGINGTSAESFVLRMAHKLQRRGFDTLRVNLRGAGESMETAPGLVHSGLTDFGGLGALLTLVGAWLLLRLFVLG